MAFDKTNELIAAAAKGDVERVLKLIPKSQPKWQSSEALHQAAQKGHLDVVRALIPVSTPTARYSQALKASARFGHLDVVRELVSFSSVRHCQEALREASQMGHASTVALIAQSFEGDKSTAMCDAIHKGHLECIDILAQHQLDFHPEDIDLLGFRLRAFLFTPTPLKAVIKVLQSLPAHTHTRMMMEAVNLSNNQHFIEAIYPTCDVQELVTYFQRPHRPHPMSKHLRVLIDADVARQKLEKAVRDVQAPPPSAKTRKI